MKYKALALVFLLLLPLFATAAFASFPVTPPPPPPATGTPVLWVDVNGAGYLGEYKIYGPCVVSTDFSVDVRLWNDPSITNCSIYGFDFTLTWAAYGPFFPISIVAEQPHLPTGWFLVNETSLATALATSTYELAATATAQSQEFGVANNVSLVTLTFHIDDEPVYPDIFQTNFHLGLVSLSGDGVLPPPVLPYEADDGSFMLISSEPDIHLTSPDQLGPLNVTGIYNGDYYITEKALGTKHTIDVMLSNITHAYAFSITVVWDANYKTTNIQNVRIGPDWILANYVYENITVGAGTLTVTLVRPMPPTKPLICAKMDEAFEFDLIADPTWQLGIIPFKATTAINITTASIYELDDESPGWTVEYDYNGVLPYGSNGMFFGTDLWVEPNTVVFSCPLANVWNPKPGDLNLDGKTDILDLAAIANMYGKTSDWGNLANPSGTAGVVDIFDCVYVAKSFNNDP